MRARALRGANRGHSSSSERLKGVGEQEITAKETLGENRHKPYQPCLTDVDDGISGRQVPGSRPPEGQKQEQGENFHPPMQIFLDHDFPSNM